MPELELLSRPSVHISLISFSQDEDGKEATVKFEILDGREDEGTPHITGKCTHSPFL